MVPIDRLEERRSLDARKSWPQGSISLEYSVQHLTARLVQIFGPCNIQTSNIVESLINCSALEWIESTNELTDKHAPRPYISRIGIARAMIRTVHNQLILL